MEDGAPNNVDDIDIDEEAPDALLHEERILDESDAHADHGADEGRCGIDGSDAGSSGQVARGGSLGGQLVAGESLCGEVVSGGSLRGEAVAGESLREDAITAAVVPADAEQRALQDLQRDIGHQKLKELSDASALLRAVGKIWHAEGLERAMFRLAKKRKTISSDAKLFLRARILARRDGEAAARAAAAEDGRVKHELEQAVKIAKAKADIATSTASVEKTNLKADLEELNRKKAAELAQRELDKQSLDLHRTRFVDYLLGRWVAFFAGTEHGSYLREVVRLALRASARKSQKPPMVPHPWDPSNVASYISISVPKKLGEKKEPPELASEELAFSLYAGRRPAKAKTMRSLQARTNDLVERLCLFTQWILPGPVRSGPSFGQEQGQLGLRIVRAGFSVFSRLAE